MDISKWLYVLFFAVCHESLCNARHSKDKLIGGVEIENYPYHVYIEGDLICSGSIIGHKWILTAANCNFTVEATTVFAGSNVRGKGTPHKIKSAIKMPLFQIKRGAPIYNFMLLELTVSLVYGPTIQAIIIGRECDMITGKIGIVTSFGLTVYEGEMTTLLHTLKLTIMNFNECKVRWRKELQECSEMCAAFPNGGGKNIWKGDGGAGFVVDGKLIGVASRASKKKGRPIVFASVPKVWLWIYEVTGIK